MIWSDMFYRLAFGGDYNADSEISRQVREMVPADVALVYWEYERFTKEDYIAPLESHKQFGSNPVFAGSSWRWLGFAPHTEKSLEASRAALAACRETGVREVICTAWGDQGNECPIFAILPTLQLFAELSYQEDIDEAALASRLLACTGENYNDLLLMDKPDMPDGKFRRIITDPCTYLLYSDVLDGVFELHSEPCYRENYARYAAQLVEAAQRSQNHGYMYDMLAKLCAVLELKSCVGADAYAAYQAGDKAALQTIATEVLPELLERMEAFRETVEVRWLAEYKLSGYEVQDLRLGGVSARVKTAIRRLNGYLNGELERLEELEEERLPFHCVSREELESVNWLPADQNFINKLKESE